MPWEPTGKPSHATRKSRSGSVWFEARRSLERRHRGDAADPPMALLGAGAGGASANSESQGLAGLGYRSYRICKESRKGCHLDHRGPLYVRSRRRRCTLTSPEPLGDRISLGGGQKVPIDPSVPARANVYEGNGQLSVAIPIPGAHPEHVRVSLGPALLRVQADCKYPQESQRYHRRDWQVGSWQAEVALPRGVDPASARATLNLGVLVVMAPLSEDGGGEHEVTVE